MGRDRGVTCIAIDGSGLLGGVYINRQGQGGHLRRDRWLEPAPLVLFGPPKG